MMWKKNLQMESIHGVTIECILNISNVYCQGTRFHGVENKRKEKLLWKKRKLKHQNED